VLGGRFTRPALRNKLGICSLPSSGMRRPSRGNANWISETPIPRDTAFWEIDPAWSPVFRNAPFGSMDNVTARCPNRNFASAHERCDKVRYR
jgi:hypothetical protein